MDIESLEILISHEGFFINGREFNHASTGPKLASYHGQEAESSTFYIKDTTIHPNRFGCYVFKSCGILVVTDPYHKYDPEKGRPIHSENPGLSHLRITLSRQKATEEEIEPYPGTLWICTHPKRKAQISSNSDPKTFSLLKFNQEESGFHKTFSFGMSVGVRIQGNEVQGISAWFSKP